MMKNTYTFSPFFTEKLWKTDLDWLIPHQDRMVILHFLTGGAINATASTTPPPFHHPAAQIREYLEAEETWWPCSPEFINYTLALLVYSVRYPAVCLYVMNYDTDIVMFNVTHADLEMGYIILYPITNLNRLKIGNFQKFFTTYSTWTLRMHHFGST